MDFKRYKMYLQLFVLLIPIPMAKASVPGIFFWRPRLGLDLAIPTTQPGGQRDTLPTKHNLQRGLVVLIDGYAAGITVISLAAGISNAKPYPHFDPTSAFFYTHVYRWALRYISLIPFWMGGHGGNYCETHKVWKRRFFYMDEFVPSWLRAALFYVKKEDWAKEELEYKRFKKYAEPAFGKHYRYPNKRFNNFKSYLTAETVEGMESSSISV